jgi:hypothetical protein
MVIRLDSAPLKNRVKYMVRLGPRVKYMVRLGPEPNYMTSRVSFLPRAESLEQVACLGLLFLHVIVIECHVQRAESLRVSLAMK